MPEPLAWLDDEAADRARRGLTRRLITYGGSSSDHLQRDGVGLINFASNDYLGLASDPRVVAAATYAAECFGWGASASPLVCGWREPHDELSRELAEFEGTEAVALFPSGFAAAAGTITALVGPGDAVFHDRLNHACLVAGTKLAGAAIQVYPHRDADRLDSLLHRRRSRYRRVLIATDGVFSMDGDLAPLADLVEIADRHEAMLLVDEAHATGVLGPEGRGSAAACGVADRVPIRVGTLSKALGSIGGFVAGSRPLIDQLVNVAPTLIYSTALPPAAAAAAGSALRLAQSEPWRRARAVQFGTLLRASLAARGWDVGRSVSPIVPVIVGDAGRALALSEGLHSSGLLVPAIRPPTVPVDTARLRISVTAAHAEGEIQRLLDALRAENSPPPPGRG